MTKKGKQLAATQAPAEETSAAPPQADTRQQSIAEAAYYRAQARGFAPGHEMDDWLEAEREMGGGTGQA